MRAGTRPPRRCRRTRGRPPAPGSRKRRGRGARSVSAAAVERVERLAPEADTLEVGRAAFEIYEDAAGEHRWRLRHRNGNVIADSGEGYASRSGVRDGITSVKRNAPNADGHDDDAPDED